MKNEHLRSLPSVDKLLNVKDIQILEGSFGRPLVTEAVRNVLKIERENLLWIYGMIIIMLFLLMQEFG